MLKKLFKKRSGSKSPSDAEYCGELFPQAPRVKLLTNDIMSLILTDVGASQMKSAMGDVTKASSDLLTNPKGSFCIVSMGTDIFSTTLSPCYNDGVLYETAFLQNGVAYFARKSDIKFETRVFLHPSNPCEQRELIIENRSKNEVEIGLIFYFEPAFKSNGQISYDSKSNTLTVFEAEQNSGENHSITVGFKENVSFEYTATSEIISGSSALPVKYIGLTDGINLNNQAILPQNTCICIRVAIKLSKNEKTSLCMLTYNSNSAKKSILGIQELRGLDKLTEESSAKSKLRPSSIEQRIAHTLLPQLLYNKRDSSSNLNAIDKNHLYCKKLEEIGISTEFPIVLIEIYSKLDVERTQAYLKCQLLLKAGFINFSMLFLHDGEKETFSMIKNASDTYNGSGGSLEKGGIFIIDKQKLSEKMINLMFASACHIATRNLVRIEAISQSYKPFKLNPCNTTKITQQQNQGHTLKNEKMSAFLTDKSIGFTDVNGSKEISLTQKDETASANKSGELLIIKLCEEYYDIINGSTSEFTANFVKYHALVGELLITTTVSLGKNIALKQIEVEICNSAYQTQEVEACLYTRPIIGREEKNSRELCGGVSGNMIVLTNDFNNENPAFMGLTSYKHESKACFDRALFLCGRWDIPSSLPQNDSCAAIIVKLVIPPQKSEKINFGMGFSESLDQLTEILSHDGYEV